jgi:hypothetical protein
MRVTAHVLRKIDDEKPIAIQAATSPAISELMSSYNEMVAIARAAEDERLVIVSGSMYGQDFKRCVNQLPGQDLHRLLDRYLSHFARCEAGNATRERTQVEQDDEDASNGEDVSSNETQAAKDKRALNHWLIRVGVVCLVATALIVGGAMVAIMTYDHTADNAVFKTIMETATEVIKILFITK